MRCVVFGCVLAVAGATLLGYDEQILNQDTRSYLEQDSKLHDMRSFISEYNALFGMPSLTYSHSSKSLKLQVSQRLFEGGGIYFDYQKVQIDNKLASLQLYEQKSRKVYEAYKKAIGLKLLDLQLQRQELLVSNEVIKVESVTEQYKAGLKTIIEVDNAIVALDGARSRLANLRNSKALSLVAFGALSDRSYKTIPLWSFKPMNKNYYLKNSLALRRAKMREDSKSYALKNTYSEYVPKASMWMGYVNDFEKSTSASNWGFDLSWSLSPMTYYNQQLAQIEHLKASSYVKKMVKDEEIRFRTFMTELDNLEAQASNLKTTKAVYSKLLVSAKDMFEQGQVSKLDVELAQSTLKGVEIAIREVWLGKHLKMIDFYINTFGES